MCFLQSFFSLFPFFNYRIYVFSLFHLLFLIVLIWFLYIYINYIYIQCLLTRDMSLSLVYLYLRFCHFYMLFSSCIFRSFLLYVARSLICLLHAFPFFVSYCIYVVHFIYTVSFDKRHFFILFILPTS